jgi:hypothetical protein
MPSPVVLTMRPWCSAIFPVEELMAQRDDLLAGQRAPLEREAEMRPHQRKYRTRELVSGGFGLILGVAGMYLAYLAIIYSSPYPPTSDQSGYFAYFGTERKWPSIQVRLCALLV